MSRALMPTAQKRTTKPKKVYLLVHKENPIEILSDKRIKHTNDEINIVVTNPEPNITGTDIEYHPEKYQIEFVEDLGIPAIATKKEATDMLTALNLQDEVRIVEALIPTKVYYITQGPLVFAEKLITTLE